MRRLDNIDLRLLRVFMTLVETGGFAEAQIALNLSPSTLSTHLCSLERRLGGELCKRGRGGFRVTEFRPLHLCGGEAAFRGHRDLRDAHRARPGATGRPAAARHRRRHHQPPEAWRCRSALGRFMADAEGVFIELRLGTPQQLEQAVSEGVHDLVIGPFSQRAPGVVYRPLHSEPHGLYCGAGHPLFTLPQAEIDAAAYRRRRCSPCAAIAISTISIGRTIPERAPASCRWRLRR